jgi:hypothetical protein
MIECEASNEEVDIEGDVIEQKALLDSADDFIKFGHIDIDHISELGFRVGIKDPSSYIIGRPTEVLDLGEKRTGIVGEIMRSRDGGVNPTQNKYDEVWKSLQADPPVMWRASIYGFPDPSGIIDCSEMICRSGATRYHITKMIWKSLALTRNPINNAIKGCVQIRTAKAQIDLLQKDMILPFQLGDQSMIPQPAVRMPQNAIDLWGQYKNHISVECPYCMPGLDATLPFSDHFSLCCGASPSQAEIFASALMWMITRDNRSGTI